MKIEEQIVREKMYNQDAFSQWLGIEIIAIKKGSVELKLKIREEMTNGFNIAHGGIAFSLADSALAFSSNTHNNQAVSVETSLGFSKPLQTGDVIRARSKELQLSNKFGRYLIELTNQKDESVAVFYGTVYRTGKKWID